MLQWLRVASDRGIATDLTGELERSAADVVVVDCMTPVALGAARRSGAGVVLLMHAFSGYWTSQWSTTSPIGMWLRLTRTHPTRCPADCAIVTTAPELDRVRADLVPARDVHQTGPIVPPVHRPAQLRDDDPVLVSFSTISYPGQQDALQRTLDAIAGLPMTAVATVEPLLASGLRVPPNVELRRPEPHADVLPGVRLLIGHGGHGTTMAALAHGVPVLVMPMSRHADQPLVGTAVARVGVGLEVSPRASVDDIRQAIQAVLSKPAYAARAAEVGKPFRDGAGARSAADHILEAACDRAAGS
ncbi:glycosyltransferase family 1 protein [Nocardioides sp. zg-1308]|uniref:glycosyltransferase n=1 Tax=Nocardioides sp. zg-1308 TaxID=2736253 RepID=UPI00155230BC|nr:glycosyltransferase [Nocardioides sp. zg-1308]NPD06074.1 glycosyltransferase family 1 protein [Nocardioides sp. zg-1308]